jgi:hypothetical protein
MYCPDDDASMGASLLGTALVEGCAGLCEKKASQELEVSFCNKILSSPSANLKSVTQCSIEFVIEDKKQHIKKAVPASDHLATLDTTLILKGVVGDASTKDELAIIAKAFVSAYNDVHWDSLYFLNEAEVPFAAGTPVGNNCMYCPDDDSFGGASTLVVDVVTPVVGNNCMYCPDDDASANLSAIKTNPLTQKALEVAFCEKIQGSVSKKLSATKSCSVVMESVLAVDGKAAF